MKREETRSGCVGVAFFEPMVAKKRVGSEASCEPEPKVIVAEANDANPLGFILGGTVMHLIDMAGAIAGHRYTRSPLVTAAVDDLQFLHPIKVGDLIILKARVTCVFTTSLEVQVDVYSEETLTGERCLTSRAFLTFVTVKKDGVRRTIPPLVIETDEERRAREEACARRAQRLARRV